MSIAERLNGASVLADDSIVEIVDTLVSQHPIQPSQNVYRNLVDVEREHITKVLNDTSWSIEGKTGAAAILGLAPSTLRSRMAKFGITRPE